MTTKRPKVGTYWTGPLGHHEVLRVTARKVIVTFGYLRSKQYRDLRPLRFHKPPPETEYDLAHFMANQRPNVRTAGDSYRRRAARQQACTRTK